MGEVDVLNVNAGHLKFSFKSDNQDEIDKASKVVVDMMARGYSLFIEVDGELERVKAFDPKVCEYIIKEKAKKPRRIKASTTKATGIGPTAGG